MKNIKNNLFFFHKLAIGDFFWLNQGLYVKRKLISILSNIRKKQGCFEIETPSLLSGLLWEKTGHLNFFNQNMFIFGDIKSKNKNQIMCFKPMSCPGAVLTFNFLNNKSYKSLPFKTFEFGKVFRKEPSGTLNGMKRLMVMTQDDSHIFVNEELLFDVVDKICKDIINLYNKFNLSFKIYLSDKPTKHIGNDKIWTISSSILKKILDSNNLNYVISDEGAFYGPKIDFCILQNQKEWQCGTIQLDFFLCKNLNAYYKDNKNKRKYPIVIHSALIGTIERFLSVLLDIKKKLPFFLSPNAIKIIYKNNTNNIILKLEEILIKNNISYYIDKNNDINNDDFKTYNFIIDIMDDKKILLLNCYNKSKIVCEIDKLIDFINLS